MALSYQQLNIRRHVIRHVDNATSAAPSDYHWGVLFQSCLDAIIESNVISAVTPFSQFRVGNAKYFNNQTPGGALIQGYDFAAAQYVNELTTDGDLSVLLSI